MELHKALTTISVWILFVFGCVAVILGLRGVVTHGTTSLAVVGYFGVAVASLTLSACVAKLRKLLEV